MRKIKRKTMAYNSDLMRLCRLLRKLHISYRILDNTVIEVNPITVDGSESFYIKFYKNGRFQKFKSYPDCSTCTIHRAHETIYNEYEKMSKRLYDLTELLNIKVN